MSLSYIQFILHTSSRQSFLSLSTLTHQHSSWMPNESHFHPKPRIEDPLSTAHTILPQWHHLLPFLLACLYSSQVLLPHAPQTIDSFPSWCFGDLVQIALSAPCQCMGFISLGVAQTSHLPGSVWRLSYILICVLLLCIILLYGST